MSISSSKDQTNLTQPADKDLSQSEAAFRLILSELGENPNRPGLVDTPKRAARSFHELTNGYHLDPEAVAKKAMFPSSNEDMILVKDIEFYSICEHHLLPFLGKCHVAYLPNGAIIGLSKIARVVDIFSNRLQVQENLTQQIAESLMSSLNAKGVGVIIEAQHLCMTMRGVSKQNSFMKTSLMLGAFKTDNQVRAEFFSLLR